MGQYYRVLARRNNKDTVYSLQTNKFRETGNYEHYNGVKLMEHSWWRNDFCEAFTKTLLDKPTRVAWVGDYAEEDECNELGFSYNGVWNRKKFRYIKALDFPLANFKYLVNNTKKIYVDLQKYYKASVNDGWCIYPISLLTAVGNDRGGGDFHDSDGNEGYSDVGAWAFDEIFVTNKEPAPNTDFKEEEYCFREA